MATQTLQIYGPPGLGASAFTLDLIPDEGSSGIGAVTLSEVGTSTGIYRGSRTGTNSGAHSGALLDGSGNYMGLHYHFDLLDADGTYRGSTVPTSPALGDLSAAVAALQAAVDTLAPLVLQKTTIATLSSQTQFTLAAGSADNGAYHDCTLVVVDQATATQKGQGHCLAYTGATKTVYLAQALPFEIEAGDAVYVLPGVRSIDVGVACNVTSAGAALHASAWLQLGGQVLDLTGATCTLDVYEQSAGAAHVTQLDSTVGADAIASPVIYREQFRLKRSSPNFTNNILALVEASIVLHGRTFTTKGRVPVIGS